MPHKPSSTCCTQLDKRGLFDALQETLDPLTIARGQRYAEQGRATVVHVERNEDGIEIRGTCSGSRPEPYRLSVWFDFDEAGHLFFYDSRCSCPVESDCKHAVALVLSIDDADIPAHEIPAPAQPMAQGLSKQARHWLEALEEGGEAPGAVEYQRDQPAHLRTHVLVYQLHPGPKPALSVGKSYALKKGGMSKPGKFTLYSFDLGEYGQHELIGPDDETPLRLIHGQQLGRIYHSKEQVPLNGETGALLIMSAARTGRLYRAGDYELPLRPGPARALALKWVADEKGRQKLQFDLPPQLNVLPTWPPHYYDPDQRCIGALHSELPERLLHRLIEAPVLNETDAVLAREQLTAIGRKHQLALPLPITAAAAEVSGGKPAARVTFTVGRFRHEKMFGLSDEYPVAVLHFAYPDGPTLTGCAQPAELVALEGGRLLRRDLASERAVWQQLQAVGLESFRDRLANNIWLDGGEDCLLTAPADVRGWLPLLSSGVARLEQAGIEVEYAEDFPFELARPDDWFAEIDEEQGSGTDWFDLDLGVRVEGERISLVGPLVRLLKDQANLLQRLGKMDEGDTVPVKLDERRILPMPVARLRAWLVPLIEFLDGERPRLSRHHAAALAALDEHPTHWMGGEALRELGQRLRAFEGIAAVEVPADFTATLRPYQQAGLNWLQFLRSYGLAGVLADDMGLGKTVQTLAHLLLEKAAGRADRPSLVIAPTSLLPNWANEAHQFAPGLKVLTLHGPERSTHFEAMRAADLILTTYTLLVRDREVLTACDYHLLVLDEAQFIKNPKAQSHQVARKLQARHRLSLTGTPLENHLGELWAQFDFLMPGLLGSAKRFNEVFRTPIEKQFDGEARKRLATRVAPFMLRRTKEQVLKDLPPCTEIVRWVELEGSQRDLYESLRVAFDKKLREALKTQGVGRSQIMILDALLKLRQVCCDPRLVKLESARAITARGKASSAKLLELMNLLEELFDEGRRVLLFSQFTSMLGLIEDELMRRGMAYAKLTGQTRDRDTPVRNFQEGKVSLFLISLKAGGTGLNLTAADVVIHYDPWWNPAVEAQATARAHRIGQDKPVFVYKLLGRGTVEEKILALQDRKRGLSDELLSGARDESGGHLINADDLEVLFKPLDA